MSARRKNGESSLIATALLAALFLLTACWYGMEYFAARVLEREAEVVARTSAAFLRDALSDPAQLFTAKRIAADDDRILHTIVAAEDIERYSLFGTDGRLIRTSGDGAPDRSGDARLDPRVIKGAIVVEETPLEPSGDGDRVRRHVYVPVMDAARFLGAVALDIDLTARARELRRQQVAVFVTLFLALAVLGGAVGFLIRRRYVNDAHIRESLEKRTLELARSQDRLRTALENAEEANRAKAKFLANMSHELRTPLNAIIGFSESISFELFGPVNNVKYRDYADDISSSGKHLLQLVNDLLDFSKVEAGKLELIEKVVLLSSLIGAVKTQIQPLADRMDVHIVADLPPMDLYIQGDELRLQQILINLIGNAIRFSPPAGHVTIGIDEEADGWLTIRISDNGPGISADDLELVMEPFQQIGDLMTRSQGGTGLGVPIARALAELHDGDLRYESEPGIGTTAILRFPQERLLRMEATAALA